MSSLDGRVLVVGATGVVGRQVVELLARRHPGLRLALASRSLDRARTLAEELPGAMAVGLDAERRESVARLQGRPSLILACAADPHDHLLCDALDRGSPLVDIERSASRVQQGMAIVAARPASSPVLFSSGWMAGVSALLAMRAAGGLDAVDAIDISILYSVADAAGPQSALYIEHMLEPFVARVDGTWRQVLPFTDGRRVRFDGHGAVTVYRDPAPDHLSLPAATGAASHANRFALDDRARTLFLVALFRSGAWRLLRHARLRRAFERTAFRPGRGAPHRLIIDVVGHSDGSPVARRTAVTDERGQTHLTALGALLAAERCLGLDGCPPPAGAALPEHHPALDHVLAVLEDEGVVVNEGHAR